MAKRLDNTAIAGLISSTGLKGPDVRMGESDSLVSKRSLGISNKHTDDDMSILSSTYSTNKTTSHKHKRGVPLFDRLSHRGDSAERASRVTREHALHELAGMKKSEHTYQESPTFFELPSPKDDREDNLSMATFGRQAMRTSMGSRAVTSAVSGFAPPDKDMEHHLQTDAAHIIRLSPIGKTYVQYNVRARPYVSRISEVLPSRSEIEILRKRAALADIFTEQLKDAKEHLTYLQKEKVRRDEEEAKRVAEEELLATLIDPRLRNKTHKELVDMVVDLEGKLVQLRFKLAFSASQREGGESSEVESNNDDFTKQTANDDGCANCKKLREILSKTRHDVIDFRDESRANLQRALDAEALLEKERLEALNVDEGPKVVTEDRGCQADIQLEVEAGEEEEEEESLEELLKRNKKMNPLSRYIKKGKPKMTVDGVLDIVNDVYDKKAMVDAIDLSQGNTSMTLAEFLDDYFLHKFGLQKLATKKVGEFVNALLYYKSSQRRFAPFLRLCGLTDMRLYNKFLGEYELRLILRIFGEIPEGADYPPPEKLKGVYEKLKNSPTAVPVTSIVPAILGARARLDDPSSWDCPQLTAVATTKQIRAMVTKATTELKQVADTKSVVKCVDLDDLIDLTLDTLMSCYAIAQERLELAFMMQDKDETGLLDFEKFQCVVKEDLKLTLDEKVSEKKWKTLVSMGGRPGQGDSLGVIYNSAIFSVAACQIGLLPPPSEAPVFPAYEMSSNQRELESDEEEEEEEEDD